MASLRLGGVNFVGEKACGANFRGWLNLPSPSILKSPDIYGSVEKHKLCRSKVEKMLPLKINVWECNTTAIQNGYLFMMVNYLFLRIIELFKYKFL
ncbi:unnamed protein product [Sphenostylis stenocarpa]|uniref:Uncharacterized protein n=1 Tax=Sphenostylis stenocarpa TaxID=92480 RepID=A0AA86SX05_9FABA|nr:unnamed protein product [Sphenostylis stenocarpa]